MQEPVNHIRSYVEPIAHKYHIRIDRDIEEPSRLQEEIVQIRQANENDIIHVYINSNGGYVSTLGSILSALEQSPATITCELELDAASAATFIFLSADNWIVSDNASMMIHEFQYGTSGTSSNIKRQVDHQTKQCERMVRKYYKHFLSESEIEDVLSGGEIYLDSDEIMERLEKRQELFTAEMEQEQEEQLEAQMKELMGEPIPEELLVDLSKEQLIKIIRGELTEEEEEELFYSADEDTCSIDHLSKYNGEIIKEIDRLDHLKQIADDEGISYPHNIGVEKLRQKILNHLDSLNRE
ncbi:MAG: hypothetical protein GY861_04760 [bacterium]|nr:hypothetical protein [bacterium]